MDAEHSAECPSAHRVTRQVQRHPDCVDAPDPATLGASRRAAPPRARLRLPQ